MASSARIDELKKKFDENPRRYFAPLANEFRKAGDVSQAILICEEFLPAQPGHMSGHIVYGQALYESNRLDEARGTFEMALDLDPENVIALRHLGDIASTLGDSGAAKVWYWRVLDADPRNEEIQALIASLPAEQGTERTVPSAPLREPFRESHPASLAPAPSVHTPPASMLAQSIGASDTDAPASAPSHAAHGQSDLLDLTVDNAPAEPERVEWSEAPAREVTAAELDAATTLHLPLSEFSLAGMESEPETESLMPPVASAPEGLESAEFVAPEHATGDSLQLDESFEAGIDSFAVPPTRYGSLPGLESSGAEQETHVPSSTEATPLDIDGGLIPDHDEQSLIEEGWATGEQSAEDRPVEDASDPAAWAPISDAPIELPPEVIAAEAELIERGESPAPADFLDEHEDALEEYESELPISSSDGHAQSPDELTSDDQADAAAINDDVTLTQRPFVTETMAELYVKQGFREEALSVYRQLLDASPDDERLRARVAELDTVDAPVDSGPSVRDFFARLASRLPGVREVAEAPPSNDDFAADDPSSANHFAAHDQFASNDDFSSFDAIEEPTVAVAPQLAEPEAVSGSIDALFGANGQTEAIDSTSSALAEAFASNLNVPSLSGRPARTATGELSLESVFRDSAQGTARRSQSFSFDQFFSEGAVASTESEARPTPHESPAIVPPGEPAERGADDIEQFNTWLQSLKQR